MTAKQEEKAIAALCSDEVMAKKGEHLAMVYQVSRWLAEGKGQVTETRGTCSVDRRATVRTHLDYDIMESFDFCGDRVIKKWGDTKWHEPTLEYMGLK